MNKNALKKLVKEILAEMETDSLEELDRDTYANYAVKSADAVDKLKQQQLAAAQQGDIAGINAAGDKMTKRIKGTNTANQLVQRQSQQQVDKTKDAFGLSKTTNKAMKDKVATQQGADQYSSRFLAKNQPALNTLKQQGRDVQKGMGTGTVPNDPKNRRDMKTMMSDPLQRRAAGAQTGRNKPGDALNVKMGTGAKSSTNSAVPQDIQGKVAQGGKVVFGKYFDSAGTFLGSVKQGKWTPAGQGNQAGTLEENKTGIIRLTQLLNENMAARRVNLMRVQTIMEKLYPELTDSQSKKLMELCSEVHMMASQLNMTPYIRTESSMVEWSLLVAGFQTKLQELKEEVTKVCEGKKINPATVVKAIDEVLSY